MLGFGPITAILALTINPITTVAIPPPRFTGDADTCTACRAWIHIARSIDTYKPDISYGPNMDVLVVLQNATGDSVPNGRFAGQMATGDSQALTGIGPALYFTLLYSIQSHAGVTPTTNVTTLFDMNILYGTQSLTFMQDCTLVKDSVPWTYIADSEDRLCCLTCEDYP